MVYLNAKEAENALYTLVDTLKADGFPMPSQAGIVRAVEATVELIEQELRFAFEWSNDIELQPTWVLALLLAVQLPPEQARIWADAYGFGADFADSYEARKRRLELLFGVAHADEWLRDTGLEPEE